jgi:hypothetical protein
VPSITVNNDGIGSKMTGLLASPIVLEGGQTYWVGFASIAPDSYNQWAAGATGANAVNQPAVPQLAYNVWDSRFPPESWNVQPGYQPAIGLLGTIVPEPTAAFVGIVLGAAAVRRKR